VLSEDLGAKRDAGAVDVLRGSPGGLVAAGARQWTQDSPGVPGLAEAGDAFGSSLSAGDLDGDGTADLAVGVPDESVGAAVLAGAVNVLLGNRSTGLSTDRAQQWTQASAEVTGTAEAEDLFGAAVAAGDFDGDGHDDLVVGVPGESLAGTPRAGAVQVLPGTAGGLTGTGSRLWRQGGGAPGSSEPGDFFGGTLASGDFDGDGFADLAIGVPVESVGEIQAAGAVDVLYGTGGGLRTAGAQLWTQDSPRVESAAEDGDLFGQALAAGDFDGDGRSELAVGVPGEGVGSIEGAGAVTVLEGSAAGLTGSGGQFWYQRHDGLQEVPEAGDGFGLTLAAGNVGAGGRDDLAVGVPFEGLGRIAGAGLVQLLYGAAGEGLAAEGNQLWTQDSAGVPGMAEAEDGFGAALG
jgi:hypothetical protein